MRFNRRLFIVTLVIGAGGRPLLARRQNGLDAFGGETLPCVLDVKPTPAVSGDANYRPGAPIRTSMAGPAEKGVPLQLTGIVAGLSCGPIAGATLEFWQPDAAGAYDMRGFNLRGRQISGAGGRYTLTTIMPGAAGNRAPSIGVHVVIPKRAELWTAIFFPDQPANARDARFRDELLVKLGGTDRRRAGTFDIRLDL